MRFKARGATILFITHHLDEADTYAERIVVIHQGRIRADGPKSEIKARVAGKRVRCKTVLTPEQLRQEPLVYEVKPVGGRLEILTDKPEQLIPRLTALDPGLSELEVDSGVLEEVFLTLLRDSKAEVKAPSR
jgi:ABC-2 type transport system ATP-binding protein